MEGDRGGETERKGAGSLWEVGLQRWWEAGEKGKNYATLQNILQSKKCKEAGANKINTGREPGLKGMGSRRFKPSFPPPPFHW